MIVLSALIDVRRGVILAIGIPLLAGHNLLDGVHVAGNGWPAFGWAFLHEQRPFTFGPFFVFLGYPILPWIGLIATGYWLGNWYGPNHDPEQRKKTLRGLGWGAIALFILLRVWFRVGDRLRDMDRRGDLAVSAV